MIPLFENLVALQIGGFYGGSIGNLLLSWEAAGVFTYVLPFLLIFAVVFGILTKVPVFGSATNNKGLHAVIAIVVGLLALQFDFVPIFFSEIFPRLGIGLSVILVLFILVGLFMPSGSHNATNWLLLAVGVIVFLVVIIKTFGYLGYGYNLSYYIGSNLPALIAVVLVIVAIGAVVGRNPHRNLLQWPTGHPPNWQTGGANTGP